MTSRTHIETRATRECLVAASARFGMDIQARDYGTPSNLAWTKGVAI